MSPRRPPWLRVVTERTVLGVVLGIAAAAVSVGCAAKAPTRAPDARVEGSQDLKANATQVRLKMRSLIDPMCGEIEHAADQIAASSSDPAVRRAAIEWKVQAVPALREALLEPNPFVALSGAWVLFFQMADFFETGSGRAALGDSAHVAVEVSRRLEQEMAEVAAATTESGDVSGVRAFTKKWAAEHPIRHSIQERETTLGRALERDYAESWSTAEAAVWLALSLDDLNRRLGVYSTQLVRQARWEAELLGRDLKLAEAMPLAERAVQSAEKAARTAENAGTTLDRLAPHLERTLGVAEAAPGLIAAERKAAVDAVATELTHTITFLQQERIIAFKQITEERIAALAELRSYVSEERKALDQDIDRIGRDLVDHAIWRLAEVLAATLAALAVMAMGGLLLIKKLFFTS